MTAYLRGTRYDGDPPEDLPPKPLHPVWQAVVAAAIFAVLGTGFDSCVHPHTDAERKLLTPSAPSATSSDKLNPK